MNDIEILEDMIKKFKALPKDISGKEDLWTMCKYKHYKAIENLIKRNKKLEEENAIQRKQLNSAFDRGFIHKDLVKKLIEELSETKEEIARKNNNELLKDNPDTKIYNLYGYFIKILQDLLNNKTN